MKSIETFKNKSGTKAVKVIEDHGLGYVSIFVQYIDIYNGEEQVLESKSFSTMAAAMRFTKSKLGQPCPFNVQLQR